MIYASATPGPWEITQAKGDIVRPTGGLDPPIEIKPAPSQEDNCLESQKRGRILLTTLTKKLAEDISRYLTEIGVKAKYLHSDIDTLERIQIINDLRQGLFDVLVGINLLREGLDIPEVTLVAILDADKEGFLRSETALIQTCGRAARNISGRVIMYADKITASIQKTLDTTSARRDLQQAYNEQHNITPRSTSRSPIQSLSETFGEIPVPQPSAPHLTAPSIEQHIRETESAMHQAAKELRFEEAARLRDLLLHYQNLRLLE